MFKVIPKRGSVYDKENDVLLVHSVKMLNNRTEFALFLVYFEKSQMREAGWQWVSSAYYIPYDSVISFKAIEDYHKGGE